MEPIIRNMTLGISFAPPGRDMVIAWPQEIRFRRLPNSISLYNQDGRGYVAVNGKPFVSYAVEIANTGTWKPE